MRSCNTFIQVTFIFFMIIFASCKSEPDYSQTGKAQVKSIDLFNEDLLPAGTINNLVSHTEKIPFKQSDYVVTAKEIKLIDSSYNRTSGDNFYLYRAMADSTLKGVNLKKAGIIYFTAYQKLAVANKETYTLYLIKLPDHALIKHRLQIPWQWLKEVPLTALKNENAILQPTH